MNKKAYKKENLWKLLFVFSFIILGLMFFFLLLTKPFLSIDEWFTKGLIGLNLTSAINITVIDVHPPLYYLLIKSLMKLLTLLHISFNKIIIMKFVSNVPYIILLIISLTKIRKDYGWFASGFFIFTVLTMSSFFTHYLTGRMYTWSLLFILMSFIYVKDILKNPSLKYWIYLSIFSVLGAYTHYFAAITSIVIYLMLFIYILIKNKSEIKNFFISCVLNVILYLPWILVLYNQASAVHESFWIPEIDLNQIISGFSSIFPSSDIIFSTIFTITFILITVLLIRKYRASKDFDDFYALLGVLIFIATVLVTIFLSITFNLYCLIDIYYLQLQYSGLDSQ